MDNDLIRRDFIRARALARWSYIGILVPVLGWVLGGLSRSIIRSLPQPKKQATTDRFKSVYGLALGGIVVSVFAVFLWVATSFWVNTKIINPAVISLEERAYRQGYTEGNAAQEYAPSISANQQSLNTCLDNVNTWYDEAVSRVETIYQEQNLLTARQQYVDECRLRYPVN